MKLTFEQIRSATVGALRIRQTEKGMEFDRLTENQIAAWYTLSKVLGERAESTTGIRLDFLTDSPTLALQTASGDKYEVLIDDLPRHRIHAGPYREKSEAAVFDLGTGEKRVTLLLPSHSRGILTAVELSDNSTFKPYEHATKILFVGDSITQGWNSRYDSLSYALRVTRFFDADSLIQAIGGTYFHISTWDRFDYEPDKIVLAYGTNDFGHYATLGEMREQANAVMSAITARYPGVPVYAITPIFRNDLHKQKKMGTFDEAREVVRSEAEAHGFTVVDGYTLVPHNMDFMADDLHPNDVGFGVYAQRLLKKMI